jgi:hypothetical protein
VQDMAVAVHSQVGTAAGADIAAGAVHPVAGIAAGAVHSRAGTAAVADIAAGVHHVADIADAACIDVGVRAADKAAPAEDAAAEDLLRGSAAGGTAVEVLRVRTEGMAVLLAGKQVHHMEIHLTLVVL